MKIQKYKQIPQEEIISKPFTDRISQRERFWKEYELHSNSSTTWTVSVLNYYGMGGIGKTELANELSNEMNDSAVRHIYFSFSDKSSFIDNIIELRNKLFAECKIPFPLFDMAYIVYCKKSGRTISELAQTSILNNKYMEALYPILSEIPVAHFNIAAAILQAIKPFEKEIKRNFSEISFDFCRMTPDKIYERLLYYYSLDINNYFEKITQPFPLILDNIDGKILFESYEFQKWFFSKNGLVQQIPNIIWCFFSREKIEIQDFDEKVFQCIPVNEFAYEETKEYLKECKVEEKFWLSIYELTEGIPLYLDICVENYFMLLREKNDINMYEVGRNKEKLINTFLKHLDINQKRVLQLLAFLEIWDESKVLSILDLLGIDSGIYYEIQQKSFIKKNSNKFILHDVVAKVIQDSTPTTYYAKLKRVFEESAVKEKNIISDLSFMIIKTTLYEIVDIALLEQYIFSLSSRFQDYIFSLDVNSAYKLHKIICERVEKESQDILSQSLTYYSYGLIYERLGNYVRALELMTVAFEIVTKVARPPYMTLELYDTFVLQVKEQYANLLFNNHRVEESQLIREEIFRECKKKYEKREFITICAMQNMADNYLYIENKRELGIELLQKIIKYRDKIVSKDKEIMKLNELYKIFAKMSLAKAYANKNDYKRAIEYGEMAYDEVVQRHGKEYYYSKILAGEFANILVQIRAYDTVIEILERIYFDWKDVMDSDSILFNSLKYILGISYGECERFEEGKKLLMDCFEQAYDNLGYYHKDTLRYKKEYAIILAKEGKHDEAIERLLECREVYEQAHGIDGDLQLLHIYDSLAVEYRLTHNDEMAEQIKNDAKQINWINPSEKELAFLFV